MIAHWSWLMQLHYNTVRARLVLGRISDHAAYELWSWQLCLPMSTTTQPGHSSVGRGKEYQLKAGDAVFGSKSGMALIW